MRLPALFAAAALTLAAAAPAIAAEPTVERLLDDVSVTHQSATQALKVAGEDEEAVRGILNEWRDSLIKAADDLQSEREKAETAPGGLTKAQRKEFDKASETIEAERAEVRELRAELLPEDETVVIPAPLKGLGGLLDTTAADLIERQQGDLRIVYGIPGGEELAPEVLTVTATAAAPTATTAPSVVLRAERMQETTTTETTTAESSTSATTTTTGTTTTEATTTASTTASTTTAAETTTSSATTSLTVDVMQNRTTSATSTTSSSSTTSSTTRSSSSTSATVVIEEDDDDEREDDLADTGTPMRGLIILGLIAAIAGAVLVRRPA